MKKSNVLMYITTFNVLYYILYIEQSFFIFLPFITCKRIACSKVLLADQRREDSVRWWWCSLDCWWCKLKRIFWCKLEVDWELSGVTNLILRCSTCSLSKCLFAEDFFVSFSWATSSWFVSFDGWWNNGWSFCGWKLVA